MDKSLHVKVAEALGWEWWVSSVTGRRCLYAPGAQPEWMRTRATGREPLVSDWQMNPGRIPRYDTDWSATGPLIERFGLVVDASAKSAGHPDETHDTWVYAGEGEGEYCEEVMDTWEGSTVLTAVCHCILGLHAAGKLPKL